MITKDILGRDLEVGQWIAMPWRWSSSQGMRVRQIIRVRDKPCPYRRDATYKAAFFRMSDGREQEVMNQCLIVDGYEGPEVG